MPANISLIWVEHINTKWIMIGTLLIFHGVYPIVITIAQRKEINVSCLLGVGP
ncbi:MAG: hypothetical protein WC389_19855 [Lutibacter sp.]